MQEARDTGSVPDAQGCPGEGNGTPFQYSCLENPVDGGVWRAIVHGATKNQNKMGLYSVVNEVFNF